MRLRVAALLVLASCAAITGQQRREETQAPSAARHPPVPVAATNPDEAFARWNALIAPHTAEARARYPEAKRRYLEGLPAQRRFFVTTVIRDQERRFESVLVAVQKIADEVVTGHISTDVTQVRGYQTGDLLTFPEDQIIDWTISNSDGSAEGNFVGKFLNALPRKP